MIHRHYYKLVLGRPYDGFVPRGDECPFEAPGYLDRPLPFLRTVGALVALLVAAAIILVIVGR